METKNTCSEALKKKFESVCGERYTNCDGLSCINDIKLFSPLLQDLASVCDHVTEFGTRTVCSTWALMAGLPKTLHSYDFVKCKTKELEEIAKENNINFKFFCTSTIDSTVSIEETDMLFIDTEHTYKQLSMELSLHGTKARKYIAFHDTSTYSDLFLAIDEFIAKNPKWKYKLVILESYGFTVIENGTV